MPGRVAWEYQVVERNTANMEGLFADLDVFGAQGWELVSIAGTDKTVGFNSVVAVLKRPTPALEPAEDDVEAGWLPDPTGRFEHRYWDGAWWTHHVSRGGTSAVDPPRPHPHADRIDAPEPGAGEPELPGPT